MPGTYLERYADGGLYTMQGRLSRKEDGRFQSFPREQWREEIKLAGQIGLRGIEWIYDLYGEGANPLETPEGRAELKKRLAANKVAVVSICADYFMDCPLLRCSDEEREARIQRLLWLVGICREFGIGRIVLPFVDASSIRSDDERKQVIEALRRVLPLAETQPVELHLETDLGPQAFRKLLLAIDHPLVKVNYDSGNSASLGFVPAEEFAAYGPWIGSFHIKDRRLGATTVPLGEGDTDFASLRDELIKLQYRGDFVLQVARGSEGDEPNWLTQMAALGADWLRGKRLV